MERRSRFTKVALLLVAGGLLGALHPGQAADQPTTTPGYEADPRLQRYHRMAGLMEQMQAQMGNMSKNMADPKLTDGERKKMAEEMKRMSSMMQRMSGLVDRPSMRDAEARKQMDEMQEQMGAMQKRHGQAAPPATK